MRRVGKYAMQQPSCRLTTCSCLVSCHPSILILSLSLVSPPARRFQYFLSWSLTSFPGFSMHLPPIARMRRSLGAANAHLTVQLAARCSPSHVADDDNGEEEKKDGDGVHHAGLHQLRPRAIPLRGPCHRRQAHHDATGQLPGGPLPAQVDLGSNFVSKLYPQLTCERIPHTCCRFARWDGDGHERTGLVGWTGGPD